MASLQIEFASSSSPFSYSLRDHNRSTNIKCYLNNHSQCKRNSSNEDSSWLPFQNSKTENNFDDSWLPTGSNNSTITSESEGSNHRNGLKDFDPNFNDTNRNDFDHSWLPSNYAVNNINEQKNENNNNESNRNHLTSRKSGNDHWALAREVVFSCDQQIQNAEFLKNTSDSPSESEAPSSGGVSLLLRRWRDMAEAKNSNKIGNNSPVNNSNNFLGSTSKENTNNKHLGSPSRDEITKKNSPSQSTPRSSDAFDVKNETASSSRRLSCPLPSHDTKDSNAIDAEKEKSRVVDIIKKLSGEEETASGNGNESSSLPPIRTSLDHQHIEGEPKCFMGVRFSRHLLRGRQAYNNFLILMEQDKIRELKWLAEHKAVTKYPHRGRIQASLRFRILRLGVESTESKTEVKRHRRCVSKTLESNRLDIMDLREKFNSGVEKGVAESRKHKIDVNKNTLSEKTSVVSTPHEVDVKTKTMTKSKTKTNMNVNPSCQKPKPETETKPMALNQSTQDVNLRHEITNSTSPAKDVNKAQDIDTSFKSITKKQDPHCKYDDKEDFHKDEGQFMTDRTSCGQKEEKGTSDSEEPNSNSKKQALESFDEWMIREYPQTRSDWDEEEESYDMQLYDTNCDWISDVARPKSDWEDMRQARYQEMLDPSWNKRDVRQLLERKSVSSFLASRLRDKIDELMASRFQQPQLEKQVVAREKGESRKDEAMSVKEKEDKEGDGSMVDEEEDCRSRIERQCSEYSEVVDRTPSSDRSWRHNDGIYGSETTASPSLDCSLSYNRSHNNSTPQSSSVTIQPSIEMELIYELRGHMEQLHQEITELRKSIKSCVNVQVKMQRSFNPNAAVAGATHSVQKQGRKPVGVGKNDCSICCDKQVDSLLYRCGHMCTCFKCAVELQHTSRECPVCEAPILDVVKAFAREN